MVRVDSVDWSHDLLMFCGFTVQPLRVQLTRTKKFDFRLSDEDGKGHQRTSLVGRSRNTLDEKQFPRQTHHIKTESPS